jgi:uncharacterized protein (TIGR03067 family)
MNPVSRLILPAVFLLLGGTAVLCQQQSANDDADRIQGNWFWTNIEVDGKKTNAPAPLKYQFSAEKIVVSGNDEPSTYKLGVIQGLRSIDVTADKGENKGKTRKGLYELKGDDLKLCLPKDAASERPKNFTSKNGYMIIYLKRV